MINAVHSRKRGHSDSCPPLLGLSGPGLTPRGHRPLPPLKVTNPVCDGLRWRAAEERGREAEEETQTDRWTETLPLSPEYGE